MFGFKIESKHEFMISSRFDIESEQNLELKIEKIYSFRQKIYKKTACLGQSKVIKQHFIA
jgi:hypothetical protein